MYTLAKEASLHGIGVHSGKKVRLTLKPSQEGKIVFERIDLDSLRFHLDPWKITTQNSTVLSEGDHKVQTVEHLLAALHMFRISSVTIALDGEEVPIMDGSAIPFVAALHDAGVRKLPQQIRTILIQKKFVVSKEGASLEVSPNSDFRITYLIEYDHPAIQVQHMSVTPDKDSFVSEIAPARTFGFLKDVPQLRAQNLALGGSLENAIVLDENDIISGPLRYPDEFVRHKVLDIIGDLSVLESPIKGHFHARKAGHSLHLKAVRFLLENPDYWTRS